MGKVVVEGLGLSAVVSVGNKADISDVDLLKFFEKDPNTRVIFIYMEGTKDGREFLKTAECVVKSKPIVIIKSGRTRRGPRRRPPIPVLWPALTGSFRRPLIRLGF